MEAAIEALQELHKENGAVDQKVAAVQQAVEDLQSEVTTFKAAQATKDQGQDEAIAAKVAKADYEVDKKALQDEDKRLDQAIKDEAARADAAEKANKALIDAINHADTGILAQAKSHAQGLVDTEKGAREDADKALDSRLKVVEASVGDGGAIEVRVAANEAKLAGLEKDTVQAAIDQAEADAKAHAEQKIADLVDSAPEAMNTLKELADEIAANEGVYNAYIAQHAKDMAQQKSDLQKEIDDDIAAARTLISAEIDADVKAEADRAKLEEADIRADFAAADAQVLVDAKAYADQEVGKEKTRAEGQEAAIRQELADEVVQIGKDIAAAVLAEENRAKGVEDKIREDFEAADEDLSGRITDLEEMMGLGGEEGQKTALEEIREDIAALEQEDKDLAAADVRLQGEIDTKVAIADYNTKVQELANADTSLGNRIAVFEAGGDQDVAAKEVRLAAAEQKIADLKAFEAGHSHTTMEQNIAKNAQDIAKEVQDRKDAITKEVEDRDAAIAEALKSYTNTTDMMAIISNVVNSLAVTMENNKMVLKLGGKDGIAIHEASLDMATDADIDAIIAGLDEE
jgi:hypothetical protein